MDVIGFLAGLAADAISGSFIVSPVAIAVAVAMVAVFSSGLAARLVEAWEYRVCTHSTLRRRWSSSPIRHTQRQESDHT